MGVAKMIYFEDELFQEITKDLEKGKLSKRVNDLLKRGLVVEQKGNTLTTRDLIIALVRCYNRKSKPDQQIVI